MIYTWTELNTKLRGMKREAEVVKLLNEQITLCARPRWIRRIHERLRRLRVAREMREVARQYRGPRIPKEGTKEQPDVSA